MSWRPHLERVDLIGPSTDGRKCLHCQDPAAFLFEFNRKEHWWQERPVGLCEACIELGTEMGWIYFIRAGERVKIGYSGQPEKRLRDLATASPFPLEMWAKVPGRVEQERELHRRFASARVHLEWFHVTEEISAYVTAITDVSHRTGGVV